MVQNISPARLNRYIFVLSLVGAIIALYVLSGFIRGTPVVCLNSGCELVQNHPASYLFGIPVPTFGLIGYLTLAVLSILRTTVPKNSVDRYLPAIMAIAVFGTAFVAWFTYTEIFVIGALCTWCTISGGVMTTICILAIWSVFLYNKGHEYHR